VLNSKLLMDEYIIYEAYKDIKHFMPERYLFKVTSRLITGFIHIYNGIIAKYQFNFFYTTQYLHLLSCACFTDSHST
jgi:hypothetical protein